VLAGLALALGLVLGLLATRASSVAETVAEAEDDDGEAEPGWDGEPVPEGGGVPDDEVPDGDEAPDGDPVPEGDPVAADELGAVGAVVEPDGDGEIDELLGELPGLLLDGVAVGEDEDGVGVGVPVECVGVGVGVGEGVPDAGSTWHVVSMSALAEALEPSEAAASRIVPAWAAPGPPACTPRARKPPDSTLSTAARTYARRMKLALSTLLIEATVCS